MGRLFLCSHEDSKFSFKEYAIVGLKEGESIRTLKSGYNSLYLATNLGRVLYSGVDDLDEKKAIMNFKEHFKSEEEMIFCEEKLLFNEAVLLRDSEHRALGLK
jgi:hypothetical protein